MVGTGLACVEPLAASPDLPASCRLAHRSKILLRRHVKGLSVWRVEWQHASTPDDHIGRSP